LKAGVATVPAGHVDRRTDAGHSPRDRGKRHQAAEGIADQQAAAPCDHRQAVRERHEPPDLLHRRCQPGFEVLVGAGPRVLHVRSAGGTIANPQRDHDDEATVGKIAGIGGKNRQGEPTALGRVGGPPMEQDEQTSAPRRLVLHDGHPQRSVEARHRRRRGIRRRRGMQRDEQGFCA